MLVHVADDLIAYASQLITGATDGYVPLTVGIEADAAAAASLQALRAAAGLFTAALRTAPAGPAAGTPTDRQMPRPPQRWGIVEVLVHTGDICDGLDLDWVAPPRPCTAALQRLFTDVVDLLVDHEPWQVLQWATGRTALRGYPRRTQWRWQNEQARS